MTDSQQTKQRAIDILRKRVARQSEQLKEIESRLFDYYEDLCTHSGTELGDPNDLHCTMELLGAVRLLRLLRTYGCDTERVRQVIYDGEGEWRRDGNRWRHVRGGVKQPGRQQPVVYRWEPFQIFMLVAIHGPHAWIDTENDIDTRDLLDTERENPTTGHIEDRRRLCTRFVLYGPRKINKSGFASFELCEDFMRGDYDAQIFCTANSQDQAKILYKKTQDMLRSFDPQERRIRFTATETNWKEGQFRAAQMKALPAGGKMPDGWFASTVAADEYGSAAYVNGRSDMGATVATAESSMGPRRQPLSIITTTASLIQSGPFIEMIDSTKLLLLKEIEWDSVTGATLAEDRMMCLILEPDDYERDEEYMLTSKVLRRKINPMLGIIAQHSFYDTQVAESRMDETKKKETLSKLFNIYQSGRVTQWIRPDEIRAIQVPMRIDDCTADQGWEVMVGSDFSKGDDLNGNAYLAKRWREDLGEMEYFADLDGWMSEEAVEANPLRELLRKWAEDGWLHIVPGKTFAPEVAVNRIIELDTKNVNFFGFGYDPYNAKTVINALTQWLCDVGLDPKTLIKPVRQNFATYSPAVKEFDYMVKRGIQQPDGKVTSNPMIHLSPSPLWPWEFGNCQLAESTDGMGNLKPVKANSAASCKVDHVQMVLSALILHDAADGSITPT